MKQIALALAALTLTACSQPPEPPTAEIAEERTAAVTAAVQAQNAVFAAAPPVASADRATAYQFDFAGLYAPHVPMTAFEGDVVLVVNTASRCGLAPQYEGLQAIYDEYRAQGFEVLGVPSNDFAGQEPGNAEEIQDFCRLNYGVTFPMAGKAAVTGAEAHPFYQWARAQIGDDAIPRWNFHKILIGRDGRIIRAFGSRVEPTAEEVRAAITAALASTPPAPAPL